MNLIILLCKKIKIFFYNKRNHTIIRSSLASLKAVYGAYVRIDVGTRVAADVTIGDFSYVNHDSSLQHCDVGKYCSISANVNIGLNNHNMLGITTHPVGDAGCLVKRVVIGNDVLISMNCVILEGVHIGDGAIIGAGAVVTHDVGEYEIWGGVPARLIRYRVEKKTQRDVLLSMKWWDFESEKIQYLIDKYRSTLDGIENELIEKE